MEEKILILKLLEEGKITKEEAFSLLEALNGTSKNCHHKHKKTREERAFEEDLNKFAKSVENFANEVNAKVSNTYKEIEPKVRKSTKSAVDKATELLRNLSTNLEDEYDYDVEDVEDIVEENYEDDNVYTEDNDSQNN